MTKTPLPGRALAGLILLAIFCSCKQNAAKEAAKKTPLSDQRTGSNLAFDTGSLVSLKAKSTIGIEELFSQHWKMEDADKQNWNELFWDTVADKRKYPSLDLFTDHTCTENPRADILLGKWTLDRDRNELHLNFENGNVKYYAIHSVAMGVLEAVWLRAVKPARIRFTADHLIHRMPALDPFYPANNRWRIKPLQSESIAQIRERVVNFVLFYKLLFADNRARKEKDISFIGLPNCFTWYNGGIALQDKFAVDPRWLACFYSESEAIRGYELIERVIGKHNLVWPKNAPTWIDELASVLGQIHDQL